MKITTKNIKSNIKDIQPSKGLLLRIDADMEIFNETEIVIKANYYDGFGQEIQPDIKARLGTYLADTATDTFGADDLCPEMPIPDTLAQHIKLKLGDEVVSGDTAVALLHAGRKGCISPLHFDWDHDNVLHVCISGKRTFFLLPPDAGWLLTPVINTSALCLARFSPADRSSLLKKLGGMEVVLSQGEAVLFPSMWWHCVQYDEASVGLSVRFADSADFRPFCALPRSWWLQRILGEFFRLKTPSSELEKFLLDCSEIFFAPYQTWQERYDAFNAFCREYLLGLNKNEGSHYWIDGAFNPEAALAGTELEELYTLPSGKNGNESENKVIKDYIFKSFPSLKSLPIADALSCYALATRNGLPAKRGLISIEHEQQD